MCFSTQSTLSIIVLCQTDVFVFVFSCLVEEIYSKMLFCLTVGQYEVKAQSNMLSDSVCLLTWRVTLKLDVQRLK